MTIRELLGTPLMRGARILAGQNGLDNEITWCAPDTEIEFNQWVMPGLLLMHTPEYERKPWEETAVKMDKAKPAGILLFPGIFTTVMQTVIDNEDFSYYTEKKLPLILLPRGVNMLSFSKHFSSVMATRFIKEYRCDEWIRELVYSGVSSGDDSLAESFGYQSKYDYYCILLSASCLPVQDYIQEDMDVNSVRSFLSQELSFENVPALSFIDSSELVIFVPWLQKEDEGTFRDRILGSVRRLSQVFPKNNRTVSVGTAASTLTEFSVSYYNAKEMANISAALRICEVVSFYDDWYMYTLFLKVPRAELKLQTEKLLGPVFSDPELAETLVTYLDSGENMKLTSEKLFIHINTLKYRLQRISKLLNCNLKDPNIRFRLRMAILADRYLRNNTL